MGLVTYIMGILLFSSPYGRDDMGFYFFSLSTTDDTDYILVHIYYSPYHSGITKTKSSFNYVSP